MSHREHITGQARKCGRWPRAIAYAHCAQAINSVSSVIETTKIYQRDSLIVLIVISLQSLNLRKLA
jgi:hypothetical protein